MTINYTTLLGLTEPVTGTQSGTWGSDINTGLTDYVEAAIAGAQVISGSQTAVTLSVTTGSSSAPTTLSQAGSGATGSSQYQIIRCTGNPAGLLTITAPASDKTYVVINATSTSQSVKIVGTGPTTGVTIVSGERAFVAWNGSDFVKVGGAAGGTNTQVQYNNNGVFGGVSGATTNGTAITFSTTNLKLQGSSTGVSSFASANSSATDYTVTFPAASTTIPVATQTLTFSGPTAARTITLPDANFTAARTDAAQTFTGVQTFSSNPILSGGTANGVLYLNGSSVATSGSEFSYNGSVFQVGTGAATRIIDAVGASNSVSYRLRNWDAIGSDSGTGLTIGGLTGSQWTSTQFFASGSEQMRLTSTGLGIGLGGSSPSRKFEVNGISRFTDGTSNVEITNGGGVGYVGPQTNHPLAFQTNNTERMRLDSSGNLGLGVTPSAWSGLTRAFDLQFYAGISSGDDGIRAYTAVTNNVYEAVAGTPRYKTSTATVPASMYRQRDGQHQWFYAPAGTAGNTISFTQAMTLDASGNLQLGTTTASNPNGFGRHANIRGSSNAVLYIGNTGADANCMELGWTATESYVGNVTSIPLTFLTNNTERARITSAGQLVVGATNTGVGKLVSYYNSTAANPLDPQYAGLNVWGSVSVRLLFGTDLSSPYAAYIQASNTGTGFPIALNPSGGYVGIGTISPSSIFDVQQAGTAAATTDLLELTNSGNAASMTNTGTGILFNQFYYDATTPAVADAGRIAVKTEGNWTSTASTQDAYMTFETALDGTVTERARITSGGNVGIDTGSTVPSKFVVNGGTAAGFTDTLQVSAGTSANDSGPGISFNFNYGNYGAYNNWKTAVIRSASASATTDYKGYLSFYTNNGLSASDISEKARITSGGDLLVGATALLTNGNYFATSPGNAFSVMAHANGVASGTEYVKFYYNNGQIGSITQNGTTAVAYNTSSDYRLKENIQPMTGALAKVQALKPCTYKWKADGSDGEGFIAHELAEVCPQAVTGEKDAVDAEGKPVYQGIDTSFLVATLTAAIQEQQALITFLTARVAALEGTQP